MLGILYLASSAQNWEMPAVCVAYSSLLYIIHLHVNITVYPFCLNCFHFGAIINRNSKSILVHVPWEPHVSLGYIYRESVQYESFSLKVVLKSRTYG